LSGLWKLYEYFRVQTVENSRNSSTANATRGAAIERRSGTRVIH
jgi:hypothetical protein